MNEIEIKEAEIKTLPNMEAGNIWAGWILVELVKHWPAQRDLHYYDPIQATSIKPEIGSDAACSIGLLKWLINENYIICDSMSNGIVYNAQLSEKSMVILNELPENLSEQKTIKDKIIDYTKNTAEKASSASLADIFGQFIGGITKSVSGGS